jgi:hypothetical protein
MTAKIKIAKIETMEKKDFLGLSIFALALIIFFYPILVQQKTFITTGLIQSDLMNQNYPLKTAYGDALKRGKLLLWTPLIGNGFPVFAEGQIGGLYPLNFLFFRFLPNLKAYNYSLLIHYFLAGFFTLLFVRKILKLSQISGVLAALTYSLSGFFMTHLVHPSMIQVASFIPLNFLLVEKIINRAAYSSQIAGSRKNNAPPATRHVLLLGITFTLQFLAGHHELLYLTIVFLFVYLIIRVAVERSNQFFRVLLKSLLYFLFSGLTALALSSVQLLPTLEMVRLSTRSEGIPFEEATGYIYPLSQFLTFVHPQAFNFAKTIDYTSRFPDAINLWETYGYLGIIPLILGSIPVVLLVKSSLFKKALTTQKSIFTSTAALILSVLLLLGRATPIFKILWSIIPGMKLFKCPTRFLVFTEFFIAILAAIGFEQATRFAHRRLANRNKKFRHFPFSIIHYSLLFFVFFDLFLHNRPINPTTDPKTWFSPPETAQFLSQKIGSYRFHTLGTNYFNYSLITNINVQTALKNLIPADFNMLFGLPSNEFQAGLLLDRHTKLTRHLPETMLTFTADKKSFIAPANWVSLLSLQAVKFIISPLPLINSALKLARTVPLSQSLNFNLYVLKKQKQEPLTASTQTIYIYENQEVLPRAILASKVKFAKDEEILKLLIDSSFDPTQIVILEEKVPLWEKETLRKVNLVKESNQNLKISVSTETPSILFLSNTYYPGWEAYVDGQKAKILRANFNFQAISIPSGQHQVELNFRSRSFRVGAIISLATLFLTLGLSTASWGKLKINLFPQSSS